MGLKVHEHVDQMAMIKFIDIGNVRVQYLSVYLKVYIKVEDVMFFVVVEGLCIVVLICYVSWS